MHRRIRFMFKGFALIDLFSILPFYINLAAPSNKGGFAVFRVIRLTRLVRILKLGKDSKTIDVMIRSLLMGRPAITMLIIYLASYVFLFGALIYECEKDEQGTQFTSIIASFWWAMATVTTGIIFFLKKKKIQILCDFSFFFIFF